MPGRTPLVTYLMITAGLTLACAGPLKSMPRPGTNPTEEGFQQVLQTWDGSDPNQIIREWGAPDRTFEMPNGNVIWIYNSMRSYRTAASSVTTYDASTDSLRTTYSGGMDVTWWCKVEFEVSQTEIKRWRYVGNDCVAIPDVKPEDCLKVGYETRFQGPGEAGNAELPRGSVGLQDESVWKVADPDWDYVSKLRQGTRLAICQESGLGPYLFTYPDMRVVPVMLVRAGVSDDDF